ncbi:hypothetical protein FRC12_008603 [Ceratobasidium sp. 428]|nr:hypothetical protein FRC12_008603 [Ceratobasidium sp. 428]
MASKKSLGKQPDCGGGRKGCSSGNKSRSAQRDKLQKLAKKQHINNSSDKDKGSGLDVDDDELGLNSGAHSNPGLGDDKDDDKEEEDDDDGEGEDDNDKELGCNSRKRKRSQRDKSMEQLMDEIAGLRAQFNRQEQRDVNSTAGASGSGTHHAAVPAGAPAFDDNTTPAPKDAVPVPKLKSNILVEMLWDFMGLENNSSRWSQIWATTHNLKSRAGLDVSRVWLKQEKATVAKLFNLLRQRCPELKRFAHNWAAEFLVQETFDHRRSHWLHLRKENNAAYSLMTLLTLDINAQLYR